MAITFKDEFTFETTSFQGSATGWSFIYRATDGGITASANLAATNNFDYFTDTAVVEDAIYFGIVWLKWVDLKLYVGTALSGVGITIVWEYWNGSVWAALAGVTDGTNGFTTTGENIVSFTLPTNWSGRYAPFALNYSGAYYIRARISAITSIVEGGAQSTQRAKVKLYAIAVSGTGNRLSTLLAADVAGGWGVITQTAIPLAYQVDCGLYVTGELFMQGSEFCRLGRSTGAGSNHQNMLLTSTGKFQMGLKNANGFGYDGATFVTYMYWYYGAYNYFKGTFNLYASTFKLNNISYVDWAASCPLEWLDSAVFNNTTNTVFLSGCTGSIRRTIISCYYLYDYSAAVVWDKVNFVNSSNGTAPYCVLVGMGYDYAKINGTDFSGIYLFSMQLSLAITVDTTNLLDGYILASGVTYPNTGVRAYTFNLRVVDEAGVAIQGATVELKDCDGNSALWKDLLAMYGTGVRLSGNHTIVVTTFNVINGAFFGTGDVLRWHGENVLVTGKNANQLFVTRNYTGTLNPSMLANSCVPFARVTSVITDVSGGVYYDTSRVFEIWQYVKTGGNNIVAAKNYNPFTLIISKAGYKTKVAKYTITEKYTQVETLEREYTTDKPKIRVGQ